MNLNLVDELAQKLCGHMCTSSACARDAYCLVKQNILKRNTPSILVEDTVAPTADENGEIGW